MLNFLYKRRLTRNVCKNRVIETIKQTLTDKNLNENQMFNIYESWLPINEKTVSLFNNLFKKKKEKNLKKKSFI